MSQNNKKAIVFFFLKKKDIVFGDIIVKIRSVLYDSKDTWSEVTSLAVFENARGFLKSLSLSKALVESISRNP